MEGAHLKSCAILASIGEICGLLSMLYHLPVYLDTPGITVFQINSQQDCDQDASGDNAVGAITEQGQGQSLGGQ